MPEGTNDDVTLSDSCHSAAGKFELVVTCLVVQDLYRQQHALVTRDVVR